MRLLMSVGDDDDSSSHVCQSLRSPSGVEPGPAGGCDGLVNLWLGGRMISSLPGEGCLQRS
jgi:hypothetical protein